MVSKGLCSWERDVGPRIYNDNYIKKKKVQNRKIYIYINNEPE